MPLPDKQEFLEKLRQALIERDISETDIAPYIERFDRFFERMTNDPENDRSDLLSDIDRIADNIADQISERYDEINRLAERTLTVDRVRVDEDAELAVDASKRRRYRMCALTYLFSHQDVTSVCFDVIAINVAPEGGAHLRHLFNAYSLDS